MCGNVTSTHLEVLRGREGGDPGVIVDDEPRHSGGRTLPKVTSIRAEALHFVCQWERRDDPKKVNAARAVVKRERSSTMMEM